MWWTSTDRWGGRQQGWACSSGRILRCFIGSACKSLASSRHGCVVLPQPTKVLYILSLFHCLDPSQNGVVEAVGSFTPNSCWG